MVCGLQPRRTHEGKVGGGEERLQADHFREADGRDLAPDREEISCGGEDPGEGTPGSDDALPGTKDGVQAVAAKLRAKAESEMAANAWAEAAAAGNLAATKETIVTPRAPYTPEDLAGAGETASRIAP